MRDVAFSCDDNGVRFLKVSVWSLLHHYRGEEPIRINVFDGFGGHSEAHRDEMRRLVEGFPKATLRYVNAEGAVEPYRDLILNREKSRWNVFTWTPVFTPALLPDATGNVVHFDIDMLFNADISPLFELKLDRSPRPYLVACCYEYDKYGENAGRVVWESGILPPSVERYFNTGTLVFNIEACRAERTWERIIDWYREHYAIADRIEQDAWNALYHDRMLPLAVKWNFHDRAIKNYARWPMRVPYWLGNLPTQCLAAALDPAILHFWGPKKPWKVSHRPYRKLYHAAMNAVGQTPPHEPLLAPLYDLKNRLDLHRIRVRLGLARPLRDNVSRTIRHALILPFEWIGVLLLVIAIPLLPHRLLMSFCSAISAGMYVFDRRGRRLSLENLRILRGLRPQDPDHPIRFDPDASPYDPTAAERKVIRRSYRNMARTAGHAIWTCFRGRERVRAVGEMDPKAAEFLRSNRPAVTVSGHLGCWEMLSQQAQLAGHEMVSVAKEFGAPGMSRLLRWSRRSIGQEIVSADGAFRHLMAAMKSGKSLGLLVDQFVDPNDGGIWVRFLSRPMPVSVAPAFFAAKAHAPIVVAWSRPLKDGRYRCEAVDVISAAEARDMWKTTQRCTADLERVIRRHPSCWVLNYDYFRAKPSRQDLDTLRIREAKGIGA